MVASGHDGDRVAFGLFHALPGVVAGRKLDLAGKHHVLEPLDAVLHRRGVGAQHVQAGTVGHDIDLDVFVLGAVISMMLVALFSTRFITCGSFWSIWMVTRWGLVVSAARAPEAKAIESRAVVREGETL